MKKIIPILFIIIIFLSLSIIAVVQTVTTFYDGTTLKNLSNVGGDNQTTYIDVPMYEYAQNFNISISGVLGS